MVEKKSLLEFLDEVAMENRFYHFQQAKEIGNRHELEEIIKEAGKRYVKQYLEVASENAHISVKKHEEMDTLELVASRNESRRFEVNKSSIINTDIDV